MAPVVKELQTRGRSDITVLGLTTGASTYARHCIPTKGYRDYLDPTVDADALVLGGKMITDVAGESVGIPREESVAYQGLCMRDLIAEVGEAEAWRRYRDRGRHAFLPRATLRRIIAAERPDLVVATNSPKSERAAILEGNAAGLPTLMVPDLFANPAWEVYHPFEAQWYGAMDEVARANLIRLHHARPDRVVVTGQPAFQKSHLPDVDSCRRFTSDLLGLPEPVRYLLVATSWDSWRSGQNEESRSVVRRLTRAGEALGDLHVVVKPHPSEDGDSYREAAAGHPRIHVAPPRSDINILLKGAVAMLAATTTTTVVDALCVDVPVIAASFGGPSPMPYAALGVPVIATEDEVIPALSRFLADPTGGRLQRDVRWRIAAANGRAVANLADLVERLAAGSSSAGA
jgi:hypothetical protein